MSLVWRAIALAGALSLSSLPTQAAPSQPSVEKILDAIHPMAALNPAQDYITEAIERRQKEEKLPKGRAEEILALVKRIYPAKNLYKVFKVAYAKQISPANVGLVYKWTTTPIGIKFRQSLHAAFDADPSAPIAFAKKIKSVNPNRRNVVETYVTVADRLGYYTAWNRGADLAVSRALNAYLPAADRAKPEAVVKEVEARKGLYASDAILKTFSMTTFLLKDLSEDEIDELSKFSSTTQGLAHNKALKAALEGTLASAASTLEAQIIKTNK